MNPPTYRARSKWNRKVWDLKANVWVDLAMTEWPYDQMHDDAGDGVYVDTFLTAPGKITITIGDDETSFDVPAGIGHVETPIKPGLPRVALTRKGTKKPIIEFVGRKEIVGEPTQENSIRGWHLANRVWTNAGVAGPTALKLEAESGELAGGATIVKEGGVSGVMNLTQPGSGFTVPVKGLTTATYNVRITYSNPSPTEARLSMVSDGPPRAPKEWPYFIPAFLPPTGKGKFATTSILWSLYANTTFLKVEWQSGQMFGKSDLASEDKGTPIIDSIELIKVEPVVMPAPRGMLPEMVAIPGGKFTMGSAKGEGEPDELSKHKVTVSPFAMAKFEVTNEEYEKFNPEHKNHRDGFSWRDREPVIYVNWTDAAKYCNWLSEKAGLTPAYEEKVNEKTKAKAWVVNMQADGYRLPTEAEWEYVASGRGEGRKYPWGNEPLSPERGNFAGAEALRMDVKLRSNEAAGTMVVGSYPAGVSKDGIHDLAGNVCEWCSDWYQTYAAEDATDPCNQTVGVHRIVRGGSWGYYNHSQRAADREFQNPNYPGYPYIGFRVVLPEAGWKKVAK